MDDERKPPSEQGYFDGFLDDAVEEHLPVGDLIAIDFKAVRTFLVAANDDEPGSAKHGSD